MLNLLRLNLSRYQSQLLNMKQYQEMNRKDLHPQELLMLTFRINDMESIIRDVLHLIKLAEEQNMIDEIKARQAILDHVKNTEDGKVLEQKGSSLG